MATSITKAGEKLSNNNLIIILVLVTMLVLGITGFAANLLVKSIGVDSKVVGAKAKAESQLKDDLKVAPNLVSAYDALGPEGAILDDAMPTTADFPALIVLLENVTTDAGMRLKNVTPAPTGNLAGVAPDAPGSTPTVKTYPFIINVDGRFDSIVTLLDHLEKSARPMKVTGLHFAGSGNALSGEIDITTYYQPKSELPFSKEQIKK
jgi:Tfp pilus assembly protein PilO